MGAIHEPFRHFALQFRVSQLDSGSFANVTEFRYLEATVANEDLIQEGIQGCGALVDAVMKLRVP
jgi:hypothetical protein